MAESKIEWTDYTFNPWWGCVEVSPACDHCYARTWAKRTGKAVWGKDEPRRFFEGKHWAEPMRWNAKAEREGKRFRVFCGSMCDVMEDRAVLGHPRALLYQLIECTPNLDWLLLTKRPQNFRRFLPKHWIERPRPNVWLMTTVETPEYFWRVDALAQTPAAVRGLSVEPLLSVLDLGLLGIVPKDWGRGYLPLSAFIHWVIVGGESGPKARPMEAAWVRRLRDECQSAEVPFFFKQWGEYLPAGCDGATGDGQHLNASDVPVKIGKKAAGRLLDGRTWDEYPQVSV